MPYSLWAGILAAALVGSAAFYFYCQNHCLQVSRPVLDLGLDAPLRVLHLSDLHSASFGRGGRALYQMAVQLEPQLICVTGDWIDAKDSAWRRTADALIRLTAVAPVVFVPGNHEHRSGRWPQIRPYLERGGVQVLCDDLLTLHTAAGPVSLLGLDERRGVTYGQYLSRRGGPAPDPYSQLFAALAQRPAPRLLLTHYPEQFCQKGGGGHSRHSFSLQLSGHAHGGQIRFPFPQGLIAPGQGLFPRYTAGLFTCRGQRLPSGSRPHGPALLVSRGLGNSFFPLRVQNRPEVILLTLR